MNIATLDKVIAKKAELEYILIQDINKCVDKIMSDNPSGLILSFMFKDNRVHTFCLGEKISSNNYDIVVGFDLYGKSIIVSSDEYLMNDETEDEQDSNYVTIDLHDMDLYSLITLYSKLLNEFYTIESEKSYAKIFHD